VPSNRAHGAVGQNSSRSIVWAEKQEKFQPKEKCFFLTSTFIEQIRTLGTIKSSIALIIRNRMQGFAASVSVGSERVA
jgi:hypothetical protein